MPSPNTYKTYAFISYSHRDMKIAKWLHKRLEAYRLPTEIHNEFDAKNRHLRPVFRDQTDLNTGILGDELRLNLEQSKYLILICSKNSANSAWVSDEAKAFIEMGRLDRIIPVIIPDGDTPETDLFPEYLRNYIKQNHDKELLGVNIGEVGKEKALIKVVSRMLGVSFDKLWNRHQKQRRIRIATICLSAAVAALCAYLFATPVSVSITPELQQSGLPCGEDVKLVIDGAEYTADTSNPLFDDIRIPGYKRFSSIHILLESQFFNPVDTAVITGLGSHRNIRLDMTRDNSFADFGGTIYDPEMDVLEGVTVRVLDLSAVTDSNGNFLISLPLQQQALTQRMEMEYDHTFMTDEEMTPSREHQIIFRGH